MFRKTAEELSTEFVWDVISVSTSRRAAKRELKRHGYDISKRDLDALVPMIGSRSRNSRLQPTQNPTSSTVTNKSGRELATNHGESETEFSLRQGACESLDWHDLHPFTGGMTVEAELACGACWQLAACRAHGLAHPEEPGIYGGLSEIERQVESIEGSQDGVWLQAADNVYFMHPGYGIQLVDLSGQDPYLQDG